ncbi:uncharacterized protein LOC125960225 [Anopheles darlingi]|uniref:uncharacterized protein LOC125960225 n=1 Tax=Anopheles darlingi TaxID=43151 RepID=UPI0021005CBD|nr:uncharacterized protein LOC125960225 [Anopheles darlingi]
MAELISCAKNTQLHSFPELEHLSSSAHVDNNGSSDCQFFGSSKLFVRANKNWGIELLRIKNSEQASNDGANGCPEGNCTIANVKKMMIENLYCVACPKSSGRDEIAIGLTSGTVRFMNYRKANFTKRFNADGIAIGVTFLDFNANDQLLAAVYENGLINLYGMKTSVKCQTISFDKNTIKARFHPTKRSILAMASYNGAIMQYDTQTRKPVFSQPTAHTAPCRDVAMIETYPDYLFSVGYDSVINIFDVRCKQPASQVQSNYPFESLAIANDGHRFAVGNLKGFVYGYDMRSLRDPLNMQKLHQSNVNSLAFVPQQQKDGSGRRSMFELEEACNATATKGAVRRGRVSEGSNNVAELKNTGKNDHVPEQRDSFMGEIDMFLQRRDSPLDCMSRLSTSSRHSTESRNSMQMPDNNMVGLLDDLSDCNLDMMEGRVDDSGEKSSHTSLGIDDSFVNIDRLVKRTKIESNGRTFSGTGDLQRLHRTAISSRVGENLEYICEEGSEMVESDCEAGVRRNDVTNSNADNRASSSSTSSNITSVSNSSTHKVTISASNRVLIESQQGNLVSRPTSLTPSGVAPEASQSNKENQTRHLPLMNVKEEPHRLASHSAPLVDMTPVGDGNQIKPANQRPDPECTSPGIRTEVEELRQTMLEQFQLSSLQHQDSERELRSYLWMGMFNLWRETQSKLESLEQTVSTGLGMLLAKDEFAQQFIATRAENDTLKTRVRELEEKLQKLGTSSLKR